MPIDSLYVALRKEELKVDFTLWEYNIRSKLTQVFLNLHLNTKKNWRVSFVCPFEQYDLS